MKSEYRRRIRTETIELAIAREERIVARYEARYGRSSRDVLEAVIRGDMKETVGVAWWLSSFRDLQRLKEVAAAGAVTGSPTRNT
jgi:hypothetical protein